MKRITVIALACVLALGVAAIYATNSYGFLWFGKNQDRNLETATLMVQGMSCEGCQTAVAAALQKMDGVKSANVDYAAGTAKVCFEKKRTNVESLSAAIVEAGYTVTGSQAGICPEGASCPEGANCAKMKGASATMVNSGCCEEAAGAKTVSAEGAAKCPYSGATKASAMQAAGNGACTHGAVGAGAGACPHGAGMKAVSAEGHGAKSGTCTHGAEADAAPVPKGKES